MTSEKVARMTNKERYKVDVPEGESGLWRVERFRVTEDDVAIHNMRCAFSPGMGRRGIDPGAYTSLVRGGAVIMSDTPAEISDHMEPVWQVRRLVKAGTHPTCLVHGLGLGMIARALLLEGAHSVTVVEQSEGVIALVGPWLHQQGEVSIIHDDALTWTPSRGAKWDIVWHDIWDNICTDNLDAMKTLHRRFGHRSGWQGSWARGLCEMGRRS